VLGGVGYYLRQYDYSMVAFVLGILRGLLSERNVHRSESS